MRNWSRFLFVVVCSLAAASRAFESFPSLDSLWAVDSAADVLVRATLMWAALCSAALYVSRQPAADSEHPLPLPQEHELVEAPEAMHLAA